jgi:sugar/nucleoside kinase (ribokinase family)
MIDVLMPGTGRPYLDVIFTGVKQAPEPGGEEFGDDLAFVPGGFLSAAFVMHRLGLNVVLEATFGRDLGSRFLLESMEAAGLSREAVTVRDDLRAHVTVAFHNRTDRSFLSYEPPWYPPPDPALVERLRPRMVFFGGLKLRPSEPAREIARRAKKIGALLLADISEQPLTLADEDMRQIIGAVDVFLCNEREARHLTGLADADAAHRALAAVAPVVVLKRGDCGARALWPHGAVELPAIPTTVVDTTGCGDSFNGGFIYALLDGCSLDECVAWGNAAGSLAAAALGGTSALITREKLLALVEQHYAGKLTPDPLRKFTFD